MHAPEVFTITERVAIAAVVAERLGKRQGARTSGKTLEAAQVAAAHVRSFAGMPWRWWAAFPKSSYIRPYILAKRKSALPF